MSTKVRNYYHRIMKLQRLDIKKKRWYPTLTDADVRAELRHLWPGLMRWKTATGSEMSVSFMFWLNDPPWATHSWSLRPSQFSPRKLAEVNWPGVIGDVTTVCELSLAGLCASVWGEGGVHAKLECRGTSLWGHGNYGMFAQREGKMWNEDKETGRGKKSTDRNASLQ